MKNILNKSLYLAAFVLAGVVFQISCSNSDDEQSLPASTTQIGKIIYAQWDASGQSIWTCNFDGTNSVQIPITLPAGTQFNTSNGNADAKISPDGQTIFFSVNDASGGNSLYSCDITGANLQPIVVPTSAIGLTIGNAY